MGVTDQQLRDLPNYKTSAAFSDAERAALDMAVAMAQTPANLSDELIERLRRHFSQTQLVELAAAGAWENFRARFNRVFRVESSGFSEGAVCATLSYPQRGESQ